MSEQTPSTPPRTAATVSRRRFLQASAAAGGGLLIGVALRGREHVAMAATRAEAGFSPNAFIRIDRAGDVTLIMHKVEMGQGTYTAMPMLIAEELEVDLDKVRLEHAPANDDLYAEPLFGVQETGGSTSVRGNFDLLREAGASARAMLVAAAANGWDVDPTTCHATHGEVVHAASGRRARYGDLVDAAARLPIPDDVVLKQPAQFRLIGTPVARLDGPEKVNGSATFGIDVRPPGLVFAAVCACPVFGGTLGSLDDRRAQAIPGVRQVVRLADAVAVIGEHTWAAQQGLAALDLRWQEGPNARLTTADIFAALTAASTRSGVTARNDGDATGILARSNRKLEAVYEQPFLAHAPMEPVNCTVHVRSDGCDVWVGTQVPTFARTAVANATGLPAERVRIHNHLLGGGFGRRLEIDFIARAAAIAAQVPAPVQVLWSREEDVRQDMYRPAYVDRIAAALDEHDRPAAWSHRIAGSSVVARVGRDLMPKTFKVLRAAGLSGLVSMIRGVDIDAVDGATDLPYDIPNLRVEWVREEPPGIPTAFWRGVGPTRNAFVVESFIDELAAAARQDPVDYRRALLASAPRARAVLDTAARASGWGTPVPRGRGRGVALLRGFGGTHIAQVAEVEVGTDGAVRVQRVVCAVDCGLVINPDLVKAQMEGGIVFGISAVLYGEITLKNGRVEQGNFSDYPILRIDQSPRIEVHLVPSTAPPGGVGEPGTSVIMPAVTNAIFAATGKRIRRLPVKDQLRPV
ncbi:xanthine dehydrogenase family protein molybdopterin-binding subunit [Bradyrhizobium sp.]|uniref:xanthine dehydrogenase family protein molybdopterin-binding subunit n=1 Tax=Bradyrhizobium sp. TaxID=376 RepID=UPI0026349B3F|nr:xanthine dehydrogenase family protein molybdopterin-binding subunit [Bradyrhizobium sp.]